MEIFFTQDHLIYVLRMIMAATLIYATIRTYLLPAYKIVNEFAENVDRCADSFTLDMYFNNVYSCTRDNADYKVRVKHASVMNVSDNLHVRAFWIFVVALVVSNFDSTVIAVIIISIYHRIMSNVTAKKYVERSTFNIAKISSEETRNAVNNIKRVLEH